MAIGKALQGMVGQIVKAPKPMAHEEIDMDGQVQCEGTTMAGTYSNLEVESEELIDEVSRLEQVAEEKEKAVADMKAKISLRQSVYAAMQTTGMRSVKIDLPGTNTKNKKKKGRGP